MITIDIGRESSSKKEQVEVICTRVTLLYDTGLYAVICSWKFNRWIVLSSTLLIILYYCSVLFKNIYIFFIFSSHLSTFLFFIFFIIIHNYSCSNPRDFSFHINSHTELQCLCIYAYIYTYINCIAILSSYLLLGIII